MFRERVSAVWPRLPAAYDARAQQPELRARRGALVVPEVLQVPAECRRPRDLCERQTPHRCKVPSRKSSLTINRNASSRLAVS